MKVTPGKLAVCFLVITVAAFVAWIGLMAYDVRQDTWQAWSNAIAIIWKIIPASLAGAVMSAIVASVSKTNRGAGLIVLILARSFAVSW